MARWVASRQKAAPANSPTPANGTVGASAPLRLADEASDEKLVEVQHSRCDSKLVALHRDAQHRLDDGARRRAGVNEVIPVE